LYFDGWELLGKSLILEELLTKPGILQINGEMTLYDKGSLPVQGQSFLP